MAKSLFNFAADINICRAITDKLKTAIRRNSAPRQLLNHNKVLKGANVNPLQFPVYVMGQRFIAYNLPTYGSYLNPINNGRTRAIIRKPDIHLILV